MYSKIALSASFVSFALFVVCAWSIAAYGFAWLALFGLLIGAGSSAVFGLMSAYADRLF